MDGAASIQVHPELMGKAIRRLVEDLARHPEYMHKAREYNLWKSFFSDERPYLESRKMTLQRHEEPLLFEAEILRRDADLLPLSRDAFDVPSEEYHATCLEGGKALNRIYRMRAKDKVSIYVRNRLYPSSIRPSFLSNSVEYNLNESLPDFVKINRFPLTLHFINPRVIEEFCLASSVSKMTYTVNVGDTLIIQEFSEVDPQD